MIKSSIEKDQADIRYKLKCSAERAKANGVSREAWESHEPFRELCSNFQLDSDILYHIAAYVWTYRRRP